MQVVWSRTAQTRSCRCNSCLHAATMLARRTTTTASKGRLKAGDVFTACYSAMFATAALVDAKFKDDRRKQWDLAIAEAKAASNIARTEDSSSVLESAAYNVQSCNPKPPNLVQYKALSIWGVHEQESILGSPAACAQDDLNSISPPKPQEIPSEAQLRTLKSHVQEAFSRGEPLIVEEEGIALELAETNPNPEEPFKQLGKLTERKPKTRIHLDRMQQMISKLVTRLLLSTKSFSTEGRFVETIRSSRKLVANQAASQFTDGRTRLPVYSPADENIKEELKSLDASIKAILMTQAYNPVNVDLMVAKICYNLLMSKAPPSINTYNIMLTHLTRLRQHHLAQEVVNSFFEDSKFAPTFQTVAAILDHYTAIRDRYGFKSVVQRMRGVNGDMRVGKRHLSRLVEPNCQDWVQTFKVIHRNGHLVAKMPRDADIFESLIRGALRLSGVARAVMYFRAALREGRHVTRYIFHRVAQVCLDQSDKEAAIALLSAIISQWHQCQGSEQQERYTRPRKIVLQLVYLSGMEHFISGTCQPLPYRLSVDFNVFKAWSRFVHLELLDENTRRLSEATSASKPCWRSVLLNK